MCLFLDCGKATHVGKTMSDFRKIVVVGECICSSMKVCHDKTGFVKNSATEHRANCKHQYYHTMRLFLLVLNQVTCLLCAYPWVVSATGSN